MKKNRQDNSEPKSSLQQQMYSSVDLKKNCREMIFTLEGNSRCVPVDTILITPGGRNSKKGGKSKSAIVKFRCSLFQKKLLKVKAKRGGLTLSEYCRRTAFEKKIKERLPEEHIEVYKMLIKYHNNFKSIGNMFRKKDPLLSSMVYQVADEIKSHLQKFK